MWPPTGLIPWFSKTEGNTYATLLHHPFLFKGKPTHAQEVATSFNKPNRNMSKNDKKATQHKSRT